MANGLWLSRIVLVGGRFNQPRAYQLVRLMPEPQPRIAFSTTGLDTPRPRALGFVVGATSQQIQDLNADADVWARELPANWRTLTWSAVPAAQRNRLQTILGIDPQIVLTDLLPVAIDKILVAMGDPAMKDLAAIEAHLGEPL